MSAQIREILANETAVSESASDAYWTSLRYFNLYRFAVAGLLFVSSILHPAYSLFNPGDPRLHLPVTSAYLLATVAALMVFHRYRQRFNLQLTVQVLVDVLVMTLLMYASGGLKSGFGAMLLVSLAAAGLVGQGRLVLFYAACATLALLLEELYRSLTPHDFDSSTFFQAGVLSAGFFATAITARLLAQRVIANENLARQRGVELQNQMLISQRVIEDMQDGVLVVNQNGWVKQHNPRAEVLLGTGAATEGTLTNYSPQLAQGFLDWQAGRSSAPVPFRVAASGMQLRARFVPTESSERDVLVFVEDMGRLREQAQQMKLAALGRLTANIAHEIRNPLSAISHAGELMREERRSEIHERLLRIVLDNAQRLERIVRDVLELGRRDRAHRETIELATLLPMFLDEFSVKEKIDPAIILLEAAQPLAVCFDRSHFHQVLWNLLGNALRHSRRKAGSVRLVVRPGAVAQQVELHVADDGEGVPDSLREQVFEPFFTTHHRGTGLGLYIARELCEANDARLELMAGASGAHFRVTGRNDSCQETGTTAGLSAN